MTPMIVRLQALTLTLCAALVVSSAGGAAVSPMLHFRLFAKTGFGVNGIVWTGSQFLLVQNTENIVWSAPPAGTPLHQFAVMPKLVEETRCVLSPGNHGFQQGAIFCQSPDHKIYEISSDGATMKVFATLPAPYPPASDGALVFDNVGHFGFDLVAATGRSGAATPSGGVVYTIDSAGNVHEVGGYHGPGGADEVAIAPAGFGSAAGDALLTVDPGATSGTVVAMGPDGRTRTIASLPVGPNPIVPIPRTASTGTAIASGIYVTDDITAHVLFLPASDLKAFAGNVLVGGEDKALFWILEPRGQGFSAVPVRDNLHAGKYSLEAAIYVG